MSDAAKTAPRHPARAGAAARLRRWALEAGFDAAGVARLEPSEHSAAYLAWLERGDHATMGWMERRMEARLEPARVLEGALSVLCVALRYHPLEEQEEPPVDADGRVGDLWPGVARYARGRDYHNLMGKKLKKLARRVREAYPEADTRTYVDTGPVLERELAARAGIGVAGKNTNLLSREMGSWFLLGELFTTLDLEPLPHTAEPGVGGPGAEVEAVSDLCGRCTLCLEACPTGALPEPYRLDANRCISYWTIEHRGALPPEWRRRVGEWVFGCDVCQEVCPWNLRYHHRADRGGREPARHQDLLLPPQRRELDLAGLLALGEEEYRERFRGNAMKRARREGLKRNAAVVMGNRGEARYVPALERALLREPDPVVRGHAAWALGEIGGEAARRALRGALGGEEDGEVRREVETALARCAPRPS